VLRRIW